MAMFEGLKAQSQLKLVEEVRNKIQVLKTTIDKHAHVEGEVKKEVAMGDWTATYKQWNEWEDVDELKEDLDTKSEQLDGLTNRPSFRDHRHEHSEERRIFELPEHEKIETCERHRMLGNFLFREGLFGKAAEQYQLAMSMYEYCFPESDGDQQSLDAIRQACTCNISWCYQLMGDGRKAVEMASKVVTENPSNAKAFFRRAQGYRLLDLFDESAADLQRAAGLAPLDGSIAAEAAALKRQRASALRKGKEFGKSMLGVGTRRAPEVRGEVVDALNVNEPSLLSLNSAVPIEPHLGAME
jgi:tetratricopeptide (TPR) repeat protein